MAFTNYSSLFRSGLLSETPIATSSRTLDYHHPVDRSHKRRTSLPTSVNTRLTLETSRISTYPNINTQKVTDDDDDAYYFVVQKRNVEPDRSFLSLDLADVRSSTSGSAGGRHSRRSTSASRMTETSYVLSSPLSPLSRSPLLPFSLPTPSPTPPISPVSYHSKKNFATSNSSFKPAPVKVQQYLPVYPHNHRNRRSLSPMRFASPPASPISGGSATIAFPPMVPLSRQSSQSFSVSGSYRREKRNDALAFLEGRLQSTERIESIPEGKNFINLSDDSDDDTNYEDDSDVDIDVYDDLDGAQNAFIPAAPSIKEPQTSRSSVVNNTPRASMWNSLSLSGPASAVKSAASYRRSFMDAWFSIDVLNFIDMHDDRDSRSTNSWRSISMVEVTSSA